MCADEQTSDGAFADRSGRDPAEDRAAEQEQRGFKVFDRRFWAEEEQQQDEGERAQPADEGDVRAQLPSYVEQLQQQVEEKDRQLREYIAAYKKEVVENLQQTRQRLQRDAEQQAQRLRAEMAEPLVEVLEALERSLFATESNQDFAALLEGLRRVQRLMLTKLKALGLERVETVGQPFDPTLHEAVAVAPVDDPAQADRVLAEISPGFTLEGRVVRPARVQVGKQA